MHVLIRRPALASNMSDYLVDRIRACREITLHPETAIVALHGKRALEAVTWRHFPSGTEETPPLRHVFLMLGATPNTGWLGNRLILDGSGFVRTGPSLLGRAEWPLAGRPPMMLESSVPGVFAAGDVRAGSTKRVAAAVGEGGIAVSHVHDLLGTYA